MKRKICLLVLAFVSWQCSWACPSWADLPENCKYYYVSKYHENPVFARPNYTHDNLVDWQRYTKKEIPLEQIAQVVYKFTITDMQQCMHDPSIKMCQDNAFARHIFAQPEDDAVRLLLLAKQIEQARNVSNDPWYYPAKRGEDAFSRLLCDVDKMIADVKGKEHEKFLTERLLLQKIRVLFAQYKYEECIQLWETQIQNWSEQSLMRRMIKDYIAGAYAHTGQVDKATRYFWEQENYNELAQVCLTMGDGYVPFVRAVYDHNPDCAEIVAPALQYELVNLKQNPWLGSLDSIAIAKYYDLMQYIIKTKRSKDMSMWYYTAAYLEDLMENSAKAAQTIREAEKYPTSAFMKNNIRMMRIYLDAKTQKYTSQYIRQLYEDLRWMENLIVTDTTRVLKEYPYLRYLVYDIRSNNSCNFDKQYICYPNLMLRKTILGEIAPRLKEMGTVNLSIALTNYADNVLISLILPDVRRCYYNDFFMAMDTISAAEVEQYVASALNPTTDLERFLAKNGYVDKDFLYDIVGTLYIRERDYAKAVDIFSRVDTSFQRKLNTVDNLQKNPFAVEQKKTIEYKANRKYDFACEMLRLQHVYEDASLDANLRADAMLAYAVGLHNSYTTVWSLTQYGIGYPTYLTSYRPWMTTERLEQLEKDYEQLIQHAFSLYTNDEAIAAACLRYKNFRTVVKQYPNTSAAAFVRGHCDTFNDYYPTIKP